jgi:hypothetical protein
MAGCFECGNYNPGSTKRGKIIEDYKNFVGFEKRDVLCGGGWLVS